MPITRSQSGRAAQSQDDVETIIEVEQPTSVPPSYPVHHSNPPGSPSDVQQKNVIEEKSKPKATSHKSDRSRRINRAKAEVARLKVELAQAKLAVLEDEDSTDKDSFASDKSLGQERVTEWLDKVPPPTKNIGQHVKESNTVNEKPTPAIAPEDSRIHLRELASAIASAVRSSAAPSNTPRYIGELLPFSGSHFDWLAFRAGYQETSVYFSDIENTARLRKAIKGKAKEAVNNLLIVSSKPDEIIRELETRFGKPEIIALAEIDRLRHIARPSDNPRDIVQFASKVKNCIATLRALKQNNYLYNPEVVKLIIEKLTPSLRYRWYDFSQEKTDEPDLLQLYRFVKREAEVCGRYADPENIAATQVEEPQRRATPRNRPQRTHHTEGQVVKACSLCNQSNHVSVHKCDKFKKATSNERWNIAKQQRLCFRCLCPRRGSHQCRANKCGIEDCVKTHHPLLHYQGKRGPVAAVPAEGASEMEAINTAHAHRSSASSFLKILPVEVIGPNKSVNTYALLDDGSTVTLIDEDLARRVGAKGPVESLKIEGIAGAKIFRSASRRVCLRLRGQDGEHILCGRTVKDLKLAPQEISNIDLKRYRHLDGIVQKIKYGKAQPTILIGQDNWELLLAHEFRRGRTEEPVASRTSLGWVLHGSTNRSLGHSVQHVYRFTEAEERMEQSIKKHFAIESLGVQPRSTRADPNERALCILRDRTTKQPTSGYSTALLWKTDVVDLPNNYDHALTRMYSTERKIDKKPELQQAYEAQMDHLVEMDYAEVVTTPPTSGRTWYLPHFPVLHPAKPGKVRPVFDAAAKTKGTSLNDHLLSGPDLLQSLPGVLMRFRQHPIAIAVDIQEMFLQIRIDEADRDALRYLWRPHRREGPPIEYRMKSVIFGAACSPCTALYIKNYNAELHRHQHSEAAEAIIKHHYMDDYLQSFTSIEEAIRISTEVRDVHKKANFNLHKWTSNCQEVLQAHRADPVVEKDVTLESDAGEKILGLIWRSVSDKLSFNLDFSRVPNIENNKTPTKREALSIVMSLFDPLGLASPITVQAKQLLQETWRLGIDWDQGLTPELAVKWSSWTQHLAELRNVNLPRCHPNFGSALRRELHTFVDASEKAYAAAVYWRTEDEDGSIHVSIAAAKARVAPLKLTSIPRLELQAAVLGCRLARTVVEEYQYKPDQKYYWSDSRTVLAWLRAGPRSFKSFVAHRVAEIEEETLVNEWRWVPTRHNVADDATRGTPADFNDQHRWFIGPEFLYSSPDHWPVEKIQETIETGEERVNIVTEAHTLAEGLPDVHRFSSWLRLIRTTARVLQFIRLVKHQELETKARPSIEQPTENVHYKRTTRNKESDPTWRRLNKKTKQIVKRQITEATNSFLPLQAEEIIEAERLWLRAAQQQSFSEEIAALQTEGNINRNSRLRQLAVTFDDDSMIKLKSRISAAVDISEQQKRPIILDGDHPYTRLYIRCIHSKLHHGGVELIMNEVRQRFWVLRARPTVRSIVKSCQPCRLRRAVATVPPTGDHPVGRLAHHQRPFTYIGLDYFGPLSVTVGRQHQKRYVALFTCLTTRAVHLEIAASLSTDSAILALRRMMARRGQPTEIWSDNGTNLRGADIELQRAALQASQEEAANYSIRWRYIPPSAPFMGGAWERLVRSVKTVLSVVLHERHPHEETLATLLCEAEYTVNSRPLTHISVDSEDDEALTPNHFLLGGSGRLQQPGAFTEADVASRHHWRQAQRIADEFWRRWVREYLPDLQHRREPHGHGAPLKVGDLVLVADSNLPRNTWPRGRVTQVYPGRDNIVRTADVTTRTGILRRPTKKLVVLPTSTVVPPD